MFVRQIQFFLTIMNTDLNYFSLTLKMLNHLDFPILPFFFYDSTSLKVQRFLLSHFFSLSYPYLLLRIQTLLVIFVTLMIQSLRWRCMELKIKILLDIHHHNDGEMTIEEIFVSHMNLKGCI